MRADFLVGGGDDLDICNGWQPAAGDIDPFGDCELLTGVP
jgi:hypothetical protein